MTGLPKILTFTNAVIINIAVIISTVLTFYFITLGALTKQKERHLSFVSRELLTKASLKTKFLVGVALGFISFILSINRIPLLNASNGVDMRYVIIYFSVIYGSDLLGLITSVSLILLKSISYMMAATPIQFNEYFNNFFFTFLLLGMAVYLHRKNISDWRSTFIFLVFFMISRLSLFTVYYRPFYQPTKLAEFGLYIAMYSLIFLLTTFVINAAISVSQSVHVYRTAAIYDGLTGVYNKESFHFFLDYVAELSKKENGLLSLSVLDIDNFKAINDNYGHPIGDLALKHLTTVIDRDAKEFTHYICRIGGDEFAIIHNQSPKEAEAFFNTLFTNLTKHPFVFEDQEVTIAISAGMTHFKVDQFFNMAKALQEADDALYEAKRTAKGQLIVTYNHSYY